MLPVLVLRHGDDIPLGLLGDALSSAGVEYVEVMLHRGEPIPALEEFGALIVLGGVMGAYDEADHPWLVDEKRLIEEAHAAEMPMFGICLGSQLFADALGGSAHLADSGPEIAHLTPELTEAGAADPVLREFDAPVIAFHQDTWDPPPGATVLSRSERFPHAFRLGSAVAIQSHPEADAAVVRQWLSEEEVMEKVRKAGLDPDALLAEVEAGEDAQVEMAKRLFGAWVREVRSAMETIGELQDD